MVEVLIGGMFGSDRIRPTDYERAVVVNAEGQGKRTRPLLRVNGAVCKKKRKKRKKDLTRPALLEMCDYGFIGRLSPSFSALCFANEKAMEKDCAMHMLLRFRNHLCEKIARPETKPFQCV